METGKRGSPVQSTNLVLYGTHLYHTLLYAKLPSSPASEEHSILIITWPLVVSAANNKLLSFNGIHEEKGKLQGEWKMGAQCQEVTRVNLGGCLWQNAHYSLVADTNGGCQLPSASSDALYRAIWRVCSQEKPGVHKGELPMKQATRGNNVSFFSCRAQQAWLRLSKLRGPGVSFTGRAHHQVACQTKSNFPRGSRKSKMLNPGLLMCCMNRQEKEREKEREERKKKEKGKGRKKEKEKDRKEEIHSLSRHI